MKTALLLTGFLFGFSPVCALAKDCLAECIKKPFLNIYLFTWNHDCPEAEFCSATKTAECNENTVGQKVNGSCEPWPTPSEGGADEE